MKKIKCNFCICKKCPIGYRCIYKAARCGEECTYPYIICKSNFTKGGVQYAIG